jgi:DNA-binding transcriptional LysR family regulator
MDRAFGGSILEPKGNQALRAKRHRAETPPSPVLISEGVRSVREAVRAGLGVAVLPDWLIR